MNGASTLGNTSNPSTLGNVFDYELAYHNYKLLEVDITGGDAFPHLKPIPGNTNLADERWKASRVQYLINHHAAAGDLTGVPTFIGCDDLKIDYADACP